VRGFKAATTKQVNILRETPGVPFWQRNYWEHVIRDEADLARLRDYIVGNPGKWAEDMYYSAASG
jgi:putative transposase